ncbi:SDR family oxidoreductase [Ideonella sp.]|uniref:SDR family oxidoreductase n=1 Tax=Ideonella sp. TaxID=1929293 RepID=UPI0035B2CD0B
MHILLIGATGFIGRHVAQALEDAGHRLRCTTRHGTVRRPVDDAGAPRREWIVMATEDMPSAEAWQPALEGIELVVCAVGIFREARPGQFELLHHEVPRALCQACVTAGVRRLLHVSALGADEAARTPYHLSKRAGDDAVLASGLQALVLQPSLVFGLDGASASVFLRWAALPWLAVPNGAGQVQPVHVDDVAAAVVRWAQTPVPASGRLAAVGPRPLDLAHYLQVLRHGLGLAEARVVRLPAWSVSLAARAGRWWPGSLLTPEAWQMLQRGNVAPALPFAQALGRAPRPPMAFVGPEGAWLRQAARGAPWVALLRVSLAMVWLVTAAVSAGIYPVQDSLELLARVGATGATALWLLYGAAAFDFGLGVATLCCPGRRLWWAQIGLIAFYTAVITWKLPEFWAHPYGPVLKNLPMLAALGLLLALERRP